ncbi:MAG: hypothetical protein RL660_3059 [Bacteroidota bacterium]|jgi:hypothetical protein
MVLRDKLLHLIMITVPAASPPRWIVQHMMNAIVMAAVSSI